MTNPPPRAAPAEPVRVTVEGGIALVEIDNPPVNATSTAVRAGLLSALATVEALGVSAAVLACAGRTFVAGGDMAEFDAPPQAPDLPDVIAAIEASAVPWVAALHGTVLGGGFEIALGCAFRLAAKGTRLGLPEVHVGLIPGAGGTQRLPRAVPMDRAVAMACEGVMVDAAMLAEDGLIDRVVEGDVRTAALAFARALPPRPVPLAARPAPVIDEAIFTAARARLEKRLRGARAGLHALEALRWSALPFAEGQGRERALHLSLRTSDESRALRHVFFAERAAVRPGVLRGVAAHDLSHIAVVGGGLMGAGIAASALIAGLRVTMIESGDRAAARARVSDILDGAARRGKLSPAAREDAGRAFALSGTIADAAPAGLAIEAVFEDEAVKRDVFAALAGVMDAHAILATNTSYLDPRAVFAGVAGPERCLGLHFFSPAHVMKLLEVVRLPLSAPETLATGFALARRLGKVAVLSGVCEGFIGNRMLAAYRRAAEGMVAAGTAPEAVDAAMRGAGFAMGPFEAQDLAGLQIARANRERKGLLGTTLADRLCNRGRWGQRAGRGWYAYDAGDRTPRPDPAVTAIIAAWAGEHGIAQRVLPAEEIAARLLAVLANEGACIVEEGIASSDADIDLVQVHGYGFARHRGGPMHHAALVGWPAVRRAMARLMADDPSVSALAARLES